MFWAPEPGRKSRLLEGVQLDDGVAAFGSHRGRWGRGSNCWYRVTISEGAIARCVACSSSGACRQPPDPHPLRRHELLPQGCNAVPGWNWMHKTSPLMRAAGCTVESTCGGREGTAAWKSLVRAMGRAQAPRASARAGPVAGPKTPGRSAARCWAARPAQTSIGYIGSDGLQRQRKAQRRAGSEGAEADVADADITAPARAG